jgi:hypothetical protein
MTTAFTTAINAGINTGTDTASPTSTTDLTTSTPRPRLLKAGAIAGAGAAVATTAVAAVARAADIPLAVAGEEIPLAAFAQLTVIAAAIGVVLARVLSRRARRPRHTFTRTTIALTAVSLIPDVLVDATAGSKIVLMLTHVVAAAIVVPVLAKRIEA